MNIDEEETRSVEEIENCLHAERRSLIPPAALMVVLILAVISSVAKISALDRFDGKDGTIFAIVLVLGGLSVLCGVFIYSTVVKNILPLRAELDAAQRKGLSDSELAAYEARKRRRKTAGMVIVVLAVCASLAIPIVKGVREEHQRSETYNMAIDHMEAEEWYEAADLLMCLNDEGGYRDSRSLENYCMARKHFERGNTYIAGEYLKKVTYTENFQDEINALRVEVANDMDADPAKEDEKQEQKETVTEATTDKSIPYVGMSESLIGSTSWGDYEEKEDRGRTIHGEYISHNVYRFYEDGHLSHVVTCVNGKVFGISDYWVPSSGTSSGSSAASLDPYGASDYSHPDDFYYDHYNDFYDYEDAEDYYYEHCD